MAIGGYTTAIMSADHHMNLLLTLPLVVRDHLRVRAPRRHPGAAPLGRLPRARDVRARGVGAAVPAQVLEVHRRQQRDPHGRRARQHLALLGDLGLRRRSASSLAWLLLRGRTGRAFRAVRDSELAAASSGVSLPIYKTLAFGISAAYAGVAGSLFVLVDERLRPAERVRGAPLAPDPDRRRRRRARLALGRPRRRRLRRPPAHRLGQRAARRLAPRPGRRLRPDRDPDHARCSRTASSASSARLASAARLTSGQFRFDSRFNSNYLIGSENVIILTPRASPSSGAFPTSWRVGWV